MEEPGRSYKEQIKEQLDTLKERRGGASKQQVEVLKARSKTQQAVLSAIAAEAHTVPEIADATGIPSQVVFWWITALRKYQRVVDEGKRGDYMAYRKK